jgi:DNA-binding CsgD family transcriptional regulator
MRSAIAAVVVVRSARLRVSVSRVPVRASSSVGVVPCPATRDHEGMHVRPPCWRTIEFFAAPRRGRVTDVFPELTKREHQVLDLIAADRGNAGIGGEFVLSLKTVRNHASSIFTKLQVAGRVRGMVSASDAGRGG